MPLPEQRAPIGGKNPLPRAASSADVPEHGPRVAILSGGGALPLLVADSAARRGCDIHIVAIRGAADASIERFSHTWVDFGQIGRMTRALRGDPNRSGPGVVVIAGSVHRPDLTRLTPDFGLFRSLPELLRVVASGGDDALLSRVIAFFERRGIVVVGVPDIAPELVIGAGPAGRHGMSEVAAADCRLAQRILAAIGDLDIGQAIVVAAGRVVAIEGIEGTDRMLARAATIEGFTGRMLLKAPKPRQERRVDLPTIGPATIDAANRAGVRGIAVVAGQSLGLDKPALIARADQAGLFVVGVPPRPADDIPAAPARVAPEHLHHLGMARPGTADRADAARAVDTIMRLASFDTGHAAAAVRGHVLGVAAAEGPDAMIARIAVYPQWGLNRIRRRRGACAIRANPATETDRLWSTRLNAVADAGFAAVAIVGVEAHRVPPPWIEAADRLSLALLAADPQPPAPPDRP